MCTPTKCIHMILLVKERKIAAVKVSIILPASAYHSLLICYCSLEYVLFCSLFVVAFIVLPP